jgi:hypothetical protein
MPPVADDVRSGMSRDHMAVGSGSHGVYFTGSTVRESIIPEMQPSMLLFPGISVRTHPTGTYY